MAILLYGERQKKKKILGRTRKDTPEELEVLSLSLFHQLSLGTFFITPLLGVGGNGGEVCCRGAADVQDCRDTSQDLLLRLEGELCWSVPQNIPQDCLPAGRWTILLPSTGITAFLDAFNFCTLSDKQEAFIEDKELRVENKVLYFHVGENQWGRFLKVSEAYQRSIIIPARYSQNEGWETFGRTLAEINRTSSLLFPPNQRISDPSQRLMGLPDVSAGFISGHSGQSSSTSQLNVDCFQDKISSIEVSKVMRVGPTRFFFDLKSRQSVHFLKISEVMGANRSFISVPPSELKQFHEMVGHFLEITNDSSEGLPGHSSQSSSTSKLDVDRFQDKISSVEVSKVMRVGLKRFFFDLQSTKSGNFLKISEVMGANRFSIFVPQSELKQFHEMVGHFLEITNDSSEGLSVTDAKQSSSPPTGEFSELDLVEKPRGSGGVD